MTVPVVAIVGRPNVGKSSLFNWLAGRRIAIVDPTAGVTRDRLSSLVQAGERSFEVVDTGGMGMDEAGELTAQVERQIETAIAQASVLLFVVDVRAGVMPLDQAVAQRLRQAGRPVLLVANKCDTEALEPQAAEFYQLVPTTSFRSAPTRTGASRPCSIASSSNCPRPTPLLPFPRT